MFSIIQFMEPMAQKSFYFILILLFSFMNQTEQIRLKSSWTLNLETKQMQI